MKHAYDIEMDRCQENLFQIPAKLVVQHPTI